MSLQPLSVPGQAIPSVYEADDGPGRDLRAAFAILGAFVGLIGAWAFLAPLDSAATANGQISVSGHDQIVAHREGGMLARLDVAEGQRVRAGQVLAELSPEGVGADVTALSAQVMSLQAQKARLTAELQGQDRIAWPDAFSALTGADLAAAQAAMRVQQTQFDADLGDLRAQSAASASRAQGLTEQIVGGRNQLQSNVREQTLLDQQLAGVRTLAAKGFASQNSVRALERSDAELQGSHDAIAANIAQYRQQVAENALSLQGARKQFAQAAANTLRETDDELATALPKLDAARAQLQRGTLRAQTDGVVAGLAVFSAGSVVAPGEKLMEIVPSSPKLVVEARLSPNDLRGVRIGQAAEVRLTALGSRGDPILHGKLTELSADSLTDERSGQRYYAASVTVPKAEIAKLADGGDDALRPGQPAQVMLPLKARSALDYLFEPLSQSLWSAFRQR
jgi:HlyD family secretion protein